MLFNLRISKRSFPSAFPTRAVSASLTSLFRYVTQMRQLPWVDRSSNRKIMFYWRYVNVVYKDYVKGKRNKMP